MQMVQMGHRLYQRQPIFPRPDTAPEQRPEAIHSHAGHSQMIQQPRQRRVVVFHHLVQPDRQAAIGQLMPRQHQMIGPCQGPEPFASLQPFAHRISLGFGGVGAEIGRNTRQQLIAPDHQIILPAPEGGMFGGVAIAHMHIPTAPPHADHIGLPDALIPQWQRCHAIGEVKRALRRLGRQHIGRHSGGGPKGQRLRGHLVLHIQHQHARHQPSGARRPQDGPLFLKPAGQPDMIGMVMGDHHAADGPPAQWPGQNLRPGRTAAPPIQPGIDDRPAVRFGQRIDVHMVQRHRHRHAQPQDPRGHLYRAPFRGRIGKRVADGQAILIHYAA